jgi:hypothetical protein
MKKPGHFGDVDKALGWDSRVLILVLSFASCGNKAQANEPVVILPPFHVRGLHGAVTHWPAIRYLPNLNATVLVFCFHKIIHDIYLNLLKVNPPLHYGFWKQSFLLATWLIGLIKTLKYDYTLATFLAWRNLWDSRLWYLL